MPTEMTTVPEVLASQIAAWPGPASAGVVARGPAGGHPEVVSLIGPVEEPFEWASVTKLLVSLASLVAVEEGTVGLGDPAGPPGSTFAHLLAHASGLPFEGDQPLAPPARRRIYSNTGIELAAAHLGSAAGMPFAEYMSAGVLEPLGMGKTILDRSPAHGARGPLADLLSLAGELLHPTLVSPGMMCTATTVAWPGLTGVVPGFGHQDPCDWGLGPEIRSHKSPHWTGKTNSTATFGHFGQSGSFLWVDPAAGLAVASLSGTDFGPWAKEAWPVFSDAVLAAYSAPGDKGPEG
jgi:CubicO group peptidase (beta-lactamase class C family)